MSTRGWGSVGGRGGKGRAKGVAIESLTLAATTAPLAVAATAPTVSRWGSRTAAPPAVESVAAARNGEDPFAATLPGLEAIPRMQVAPPRQQRNGHPVESESPPTKSMPSSAPPASAPPVREPRRDGAAALPIGDHEALLGADEVLVNAHYEVHTYAGAATSESHTAPARGRDAHLLPRVANVHKDVLRRRGYKDLLDWKSRCDGSCGIATSSGSATAGGAASSMTAAGAVGAPTRHVYIGRDMSRFVPGAVSTKWGNPNKGIPAAESLGRYEALVRANTNGLWDALDEFIGVGEIGCWCKPRPCHGDVIVYLLREKLRAKGFDV